MTDGRVRVEGIRELRTALKRANVEGANKALREAHKVIAKDLEGAVRGQGTAQQQKAYRAVLGKADTTSAYLAIRNLVSTPFGLGAFMGSKRYAQFPEWVGDNWDIEAGQGPYVIAPTIARKRTEIIDTYTEQLRTTFAALGLEWE